jgi:penicillin amidase
VITAAVVVILIVGVLAFASFSVRRAFPDVDGNLVVPGLVDDVGVVRDSVGVPTITASNPHDLFMAQGYVHAQERFWQMDFWRHIGAGRLAEMFGADQLETDLFLRTLGWEQLAAEQYAAAPPEHRAVLDAYAAGVNAYLAERSPAELSFEYTVLELLNRGYEVEAWTPVNTLTWGMVMAWDLGGNLRNEIDRAVLLGSLSPEQVAQLYPPYPGDRNPYIVSPDPAALTAAAGTSTLARDALARIDTGLDRITVLGGSSDAGIGSNSWVVSGARTTTGAPILANDPHLAIQMPSIWYQLALQCTPVSPDCPYQVTGFTFAGVPGVIIGHNADIAWGVTNLGPDVQDLYVERIDGDRYEVNGEWQPMEIRNEVIEVAGGDPVELEVRSTRHGPIISDVFEPLEDFGDVAGGVEVPDPYAVALRWTALDHNPGIVTTFLGLAKAENWADFREALAGFAVPAQNFVYADTKGNIGYQTPGNIPIRASGDGTVPVPGWTDEHEWTGFIPFEDLPSVSNPDSGYIVTANNAVVDDAYPYLITYDWNYGYRARRLVDLIDPIDLVGATEATDLDDHAAIQFDASNLNAERTVPFLLDVDADGTAEEMQSVLASWDLANKADSAGAAAFGTTWRRLLELTFHDDLPEDQWPAGGGRWFTVVGEMLDDPADPFWNDAGSAETEHRDDILAAALEAASADLTDEFGADPDDWQWGDLHTATFENQTLGQSGIALVDDRFNRGRFPVSGGDDLVNATGWDPVEGFEVDWVPSMRMLVDLGDLSKSLTVHTTGQSGHVDHPHYDDLIPLWQSGRYYPMRWTAEQVATGAAEVQTLRPG